MTGLVVAEIDGWDVREVPDRTSLPLDRIKADYSAQPRENLNTDITEAYERDLKSGHEFPPITVFWDGENYWLADGFHRRYAALNIGLKDFPAEIRKGDLRDAILFSCGANADHGKRRTNEDKRRAVTRLLEDEEWSHWSDSEIARQCRVHRETVAKVRTELNSHLSKPASDERTYTTKHGTKAKMKISLLKSRGSITLPEGKTPEDIAHEGIELERGGAFARDVARKFGLREQTYSQIRDVVLVAERTDLNDCETQQAHMALEILNENHQVSEPTRLIRPIVKRIWGARRGRTEKAEAKRFEKFQSDIMLATGACEMCAANIDIPHLTNEQRAAATKDLRTAERALAGIRQRIKGD